MLPATPPQVTAWTLSHWMPPCWRYKSIWKVQTLKCTKRKWAATTAKSILLHPNGAIKLLHVTFKQQGKLVHSVAWLDLSHKIDQCSCVITILRPLHNWHVQEALNIPPRPLPQHIKNQRIESKIKIDLEPIRKLASLIRSDFTHLAITKTNSINKITVIDTSGWWTLSFHTAVINHSGMEIQTFTNDFAERINKKTMNQHENKTQNVDRWLYGTSTNLDSTG